MKEKKNPVHGAEEKAAAGGMAMPQNEASAASARAPEQNAPSSGASPQSRPLLGTGELIIGVLIIILLGTAAYTFMSWAPAEKPGTIQPSSGNATDAFISSLYKMRNIRGYESSYVLTIDQFETSIYLQSNVTHQYGRFDSILDTIEFYFDGDNVVLCQEYQTRSCYRVSKNGSIFDPYVQSVYAKFLESPAERNTQRTNEKLVQVGAIKFDDGVSKGTVAGRSCTEVTYSTNYGGLSINQLRELGMEPNDPAIISYGDFRTTQCMDNESGLSLRLSMSYSKLGEERKFGILYSSFKDGFDGAVPAPPESESYYVSESRFEQSFHLAQRAALAAYACSAQNGTSEQDSCFRTLAYSSEDGRVCGMVKDGTAKSQCYLALAQKTLNSGECAFAGTLKDDCYLALAGSTGDGALCPQIENTTLASECEKAADAAHKRGVYPKNETPACNAGSGCVVAGCNNELCVPAAIANSTSTTCDPALTCYRALANCTCGTAGQCEWIKQDGFDACIDKWETEQARRLIEPLINATMNATANATGNASNESR